ncbi:aspartate/glutamate racemase family protein [Rivularia sp. UHCC 0363]|uniref:aspartate/glutamate racemase family protein n=1 Tax=Rivularia sp. UHCC 0363 TaxID=3110244 RepID=UPI002B21412C|nr:amino acid racemase [Rivularia sp. UHCC 0363]MEA5595925.1 amino acid racemase [Rivularia sp. UHCC 0363]
MKKSYNRVKKEIFGVLGGMGPLASAEFLKTIYENNILGQREQQSPQVIVYSDPTFPDRTETLLGGDYKILLDNLISALYNLCELNVSKIVICCITSHYLLPQLPYELRDRIISLVDIIFKKILEQQKKHLLICSTGTHKLEIFQNHILWQFAQDYILLPDKNDQNLIHEMIYYLKVNGGYQKCIPILDSLQVKYNVQKMIAGCTEIHLLNKHLQVSIGKQKEQLFLDPLMVISEELWNISILQEYTDLPNNIAGFKFLSQIFSPEYFVNK